MTHMLGAVQLTLALLISGCTIYYITSEWYRRKSQAGYEKAFLDRHRAYIYKQQEQPHLNEFIPLTLPYHQLEELLSMFCKQNLTTENDFWSPESEEVFEAQTQVLSMRFRRLAEFAGTIKVQAIRCKTNYAVIGAGDRQMGYILMKNDYDPNVFNIFAKFQYEITSVDDLEAFPHAIKKD